MIPSKGISPNPILADNIKQPIDNNKGSNSSYIVSFSQQKKSISSNTPSKVPTQASSTYTNINRAKLGDTENPYKDKSFSEIRDETRPIYDALRSAESSANIYDKEYDKTQNNPEGKAKWKAYKSAREDLPKNGDLQNSDEYRILNKRPNKSHLEKLLAGSPLSKKLDPLTGIFRDTKTGLYAQLKPLGDSSGGYALCFGSTGIGRMTMKQIKVDMDQVLNQREIPAAYKQAVELATALHKALEAPIKASIKKELEDANILFGGTGTITNEDINEELNNKFNFTVTGQSMGGGIANYVGLKLGINSVCYNPAALGPAAIKDLKDDGRLTTDNLSKQKIIRQKGDIISGEKNQKKIALLANLFSIKKIKRPQHLGQIYVANKSEAPSLNGVTRGCQARHFTSAFDHFYYSRTTPAAQPTTPSTNSDASSESSSASSRSGGE